MSGHQYLLIAKAVGYRRQVGLGVGHQHVFGLGAVDGVAKAPATHGLVAVTGAAAILGRQAVLAGIGVKAWADGASDYPLTFLVALNITAQFFDHPHRLMANGQAGGHRVFTLEDVHVSATDRGGGNAQQGVVWAHLGDGLVDQFDPARGYKDGGFHHAHQIIPSSR